MSGTLAGLSGADPAMANSPMGQQMLASMNPQNLAALGAQERAAGPAAGQPPEVPARQIMMPSDPSEIAMMGPNFARGRRARRR